MVTKRCSQPASEITSSFARGISEGSSKAQPLQSPHCPCVPFSAAVHVTLRSEAGLSITVSCVSAVSSLPSFATLNCMSHLFAFKSNLQSTQQINWLCLCCPLPCWMQGKGERAARARGLSWQPVLSDMGCCLPGSWFCP